MSITLYTSPACAYCHMAREYLKHRKVTFKEYDVAENPKAMEWVRENVGQIATPVIDIDGTVILGFDRQKIDIALRG